MKAWISLHNLAFTSLVSRNRIPGLDDFSAVTFILIVFFWRVTLVSLVMVPFSTQGFQFSYMLNNMRCLLMQHPCWDVMVLFYVFWVLSHQQIQCHKDLFLFSMRFRISNLVFESSKRYKLILFTCPFLWRSSSLASFIEETVYSIQNGSSLGTLSRVRQRRNNRHVDTCTKNRK